MKLHNPLLFIALVVCSVLNILDLVTSYFILPGEGNPIYILTKNFLFFLVFKIILLIFAWYFYIKNYFPGEFHYYLFILFIVMYSSLLILAVISNIQGILNPEIVNIASKLSTGEKLKGYFMFVFLIYILPTTASIISFLIYHKSYKNIQYKNSMRNKNEMG
jgi:hypothetical protein